MKYSINFSKLTEEQRKLHEMGLCVSEGRAEIKCSQDYRCLKEYDSKEIALERFARKQIQKTNPFANRTQLPAELELVCIYSLSPEIRKKLLIE